MPNFWPKGCTFYKSQCGYCDIFHNTVLQLTFKTAFCTIALMTVYTAEYLLVLACILQV